jgi:hypothetical protein
MVLVSGSALAQTVSVSDPAGDGLKGHRLDITEVKVANRDHAIITTISFVRVAHGDLGVAMKARGDRRKQLVGVTSVHRASGDTNLFRTFAGVQKCKGLSVTWDATTNRVRVRVPSRCLDNGNYGALKVKAITEIGSDADVAPKDPKGNWRWTEWASRG